MQAMIGKLLINVVPAVIMTISLIQMSSINFVGAFGRGILTRRNAFQSFTQKKTLISPRPSLSCPLWSAKDDRGQEESNDHQTPSSSSSIARPSDVLMVDQMPLPLPIPLKHTYYLLRHGQSEGNVEGVISSCRSLKYSSKHGLTPLGYQQGYDSAKSLLELIQQQSQTTSGEDQAGAGGRNTSRIIFLFVTFCQGQTDGSSLH
jgi:Fructose-2,6-bisphosphatase